MKDFIQVLKNDEAIQCLIKKLKELDDDCKEIRGTSRFYSYEKGRELSREIATKYLECEKELYNLIHDSFLKWCIQHLNGEAKK